MVFDEIAEYDNILYSSANSPFVTAMNTKVHSDNQFKLSWHEEMEIKYILSGSLCINVGTERICAQKGDVVIINPCEHHLNQVEPGADATYNVLCVDLSRVFNNVILKSGNIPFESINMRFNNLIRNDSKVKNILSFSLIQFLKTTPYCSSDCLLPFFLLLNLTLI